MFLDVVQMHHHCCIWETHAEPKWLLIPMFCVFVCVSGGINVLGCGANAPPLLYLGDP